MSIIADVTVVVISNNSRYNSNSKYNGRCNTYNTYNSGRY